jgi:hypothetical protein
VSEGLVSELLVAFGLAALAFTAGFAGGAQHERQAAAAKAAAEAAAQQRTLAAERTEGDKAVAGLRQQLEQARSYQQTLAQRIAHAPLVANARCPQPPLVGRAGGSAVPGGVGGGGAGDRGGIAADPAAPPGAALPDAGAGGGDIRLSLGAVSLWNSALFGLDLPAGACRADDPASPACAADAGIGLADAWANHATNAATCAADRARYAALIGYLTQRQKRIATAVPSESP